MKCINCTNWEPYKEYPNFGRCKSPKFIEGAAYWEKGYDPDSLLYCSGGMDSAGFETGAEFGCIHFKSKDVAKDEN